MHVTETIQIKKVSTKNIFGCSFLAIYEIYTKCNNNNNLKMIFACVLYTIFGLLKPCIPDWIPWLF